MHTILGAGGIIANSLAKILGDKNEKFRLVSRNPKPLPGSEILAADLTDPGQTLKAVQQSSIVYLCVGLPYNYSIWRSSWPKIITNVIDACKTTSARLIFFDNVYMYGKVDGWMTEETPYNPSSRKGDLRARIATQIMSEVRKGNITASIARAADFYGPSADKTSIPNLMVFDKLAKKQKPQWLVNAKTRHSYTYTPDAAKALYILGQSEGSWNQVWHLPTAPNPLTGEEFIAKAAAHFDAKPGYFVIRPWMMALGGLFDRTIAELYEMTYQLKFDYLFDSSKFENAFNFVPTSYDAGIAEVAEAKARNSV
ncbi:MAG TPA: NAD-dependent epimerase/dehydratase family protein [Puia sp.]|nr:NAD-dependent epimerase/dehydratase family protein [Puia sp.]